MEKVWLRELSKNNNRRKWKEKRPRLRVAINRHDFSSLELFESPHLNYVLTGSSTNYEERRRIITDGCASCLNSLPLLYTVLIALSAGGETFFLTFRSSDQ
jgi:hypothetical protein